MTYRYIDFASGYGQYLSHMGVEVGDMRAMDIHIATTIEAPACLDGLDTHRHPAIVGAFTYFGARGVFKWASIGRYCSVAERVQVGMQGHPINALTTSIIAFREGDECLTFESFLKREHPGWQRNLPCIDFDSTAFTNIGNDVWIGCNAYLKDGITIGDGAVIGAHAVVTKDVPPYAIVAGSPARIIRYRFDEKTIERLLALRWWDYNILEMGDLDMADIASAIGTIEDKVAAGLEPYVPPAINLVEEYDRFLVLHDQLIRQRA